MSHLARRQYPCHKHLSLSLSQLSCHMHRQSRQCLAASEPCQICACSNSQCLKAAWFDQTLGFHVKRVWVAIALVTAPAAATRMPMHTCSISMPCVVHMPYTFPSSCLLCPAVVSCTQQFWCHTKWAHCNPEALAPSPCCWSAEQSHQAETRLTLHMTSSSPTRSPEPSCC
jgi:hypothetical protein